MKDWGWGAHEEPGREQRGQCPQVEMYQRRDLPRKWAWAVLLSVSTDWLVHQ